MSSASPLHLNEPTSIAATFAAGRCHERKLRAPDTSGTFSGSDVVGHHLKSKKDLAGRARLVRDRVKITIWRQCDPGLPVNMAGNATSPRAHEQPASAHEPEAGLLIPINPVWSAGE